MKWNILQFTPLRKKLLTIFVIVFFAPLFKGFYLADTVEGVADFFHSNLGYISIIAAPLEFLRVTIQFAMVLLTNIPAVIFGHGFLGNSFLTFGFGGVGLDTVGWIITIVFWLVIAFLLSWPGNLKDPIVRNGGAGRTIKPPATEIQLDR